MPSAGGSHDDYIRAAAAARGIDPASALAIAHGEGLPGGKPVAWGSGIDNGTSFGDYQLHRDGRSHTAVGDQYEKKFGTMKPEDWKQMDDFALDYAGTHGWGAWSSRDKVGVGDRGGLEHYHPAMPQNELPAPRKVQTTKEKPRVDNNPRVNNNQSEVTINKNVGGNPVNTINSVAQQQ
jgi:hypothetical protein